MASSPPSMPESRACKQVDFEEVAKIIPIYPINKVLKTELFYTNNQIQRFQIDALLDAEDEDDDDDVDPRHNIFHEEKQKHIRMRLPAKIRWNASRKRLSISWNSFKDRASEPMTMYSKR